MDDPLENLAKSQALLRDAQREGLNFIKTEIHTGLTFAKMAMDAIDDSEKRARNAANASKAYRTVLSWRDRFCSAEPMRRGMQDLEPLLEQLKHALEQLGEVL